MKRAEDFISENELVTADYLRSCGHDEIGVGNDGWHIFRIGDKTVMASSVPNFPRVIEIEDYKIVDNKFIAYLRVQD